MKTGYWSQVVPIPGFVGTATASMGTAGTQGDEGKEAIIDAQESEDFLDGRTDTSNARLPYASTLLQLNRDPNEARFLQQNDIDDGTPQTVEYLSQAPTTRVPLDFHFIGLSQKWKKRKW